MSCDPSPKGDAGEILLLKQDLQGLQSAKTCCCNEEMIFVLGRDVIDKEACFK